MKKYKLSELFKNSFYFRSQASDGLRNTIEREAQVIEVSADRGSIFRKPLFWIIVLPVLALLLWILYIVVTEPAARSFGYWTEAVSQLFSGEEKTQEELLLEEIKNIFLEAE